MDEHQERKQQEFEEEPAAGPSRWVAILAVFALLAAGLAFGYGYQQRTSVSQLTAQATEQNSTISDLQSQLGAVTAKMNEISAAQAQAEQERAQAAAAAKNNARSTTARRTPAEDKRFKELQSKLDDQQKQLKDTQDSVAQARSDLETNLGLTKDELNGSIARTHDELVVLQKRGERNYIEFDLTKSKQFYRSGDIMLSLRKADVKHKSFDLTMIVDDNQLTKKKVNLYEPIWIHTGDYAQPLQVVVNKIDKNRVHGYVSAPKYKLSDLNASAAPANDRQGSPNPQRPPE